MDFKHFLQEVHPRAAAEEDQDPLYPPNQVADPLHQGFIFNIVPPVNDFLYLFLT